MTKLCDADSRCKLLHVYKPLVGLNGARSNHWRACKYQQRTGLCLDSPQECELWAASGYCDSAAKYMQTHCQSSCGFCPPDTNSSFVSYQPPFEPGFAHSRVDILTKALRAPFSPTSASKLYGALCATTEDSQTPECTFPSRVTLDATLECTAEECTADDIRVVKLVDSGNGNTATYSRVPHRCVKLSFFNGARVNSHTQAGSREMCADPAVAGIAGAVCCSATAPGTVLDPVAGTLHAFEAESVRMSTAAARCSTASFNNSNGAGVLCPGSTSIIPDASLRAPEHPWWTSDQCMLQVQVHSDGYVTEVDPLAAGFDPRLKAGTGPKFRVRWNDAQGGGDARYPSVPDGSCAAHAGCSVHASDQTCVCNVTIETAVVYDSADSLPTVDTARKVRAALSLGATAPGTYGAGVYSKCTSAACISVGGILTIYTRDGHAIGSADTIFELSDASNYQHRFFLNRLSTVHVGSTDTLVGFSFRNAPVFMPFVGEHVGLTGPAQGWNWNQAASHRAQYETEALIDHLLWHQNTAPFVATLLINRFVSSNPSPRYVSSVASAFRSGTYGGRAYSGKRGDLAATFTAILLDREARSAVVEADAMHGRLHEPLMKVVGLMRSMEFATKDGQETKKPPPYLES